MEPKGVKYKFSVQHPEVESLAFCIVAVVWRMTFGYLITHYDPLSHK